MTRRLLLCAALLILLLPSISQAWWNQEWTARKKITLDTSQKGAGINEPLTNVPVLVRLHTGNFQFDQAQVEGHDIRFVAADDKTPLKFSVEQFDGVNQLAWIWVQVPKLDANAATNEIWIYYGNDKAPPASDAKFYDNAQTLILHFNEQSPGFKDATAYAHAPSINGVTSGATGLVGGSAVFNGASQFSLPAVPSLKVSTNGFTYSAWIKPGNNTQSATLYSQQEGANSIQVLYQQGKLFAKVGTAETTKVDLVPEKWNHVAVTVSDRTVVFLNGAEAASGSGKAVDLGGNITVGAAFVGEIDELQLSNIARSAGWIKAQAASQGEAATMVAVAAEGESDEGGSSYLSILLSAVTIDGWVVIAILMVMMVISFIVMILKGVFLSRTDSANRSFLRKFAESASGDLLALDRPTLPGVRKDVNSSLYRIYKTASSELQQRDIGNGSNKMLSNQALNAIRASLDANVVRENARLNSQMVLLTIAISGGPFLGLLGTVVGVMITFAAIAAVGDVNVNSIAPGIAAALVATVAGLGVAIPALFGYNYLASRIKNISADMAVFVDELIGRIAEKYSAS